MEEARPIRRAFMLLCYASAGLLGLGAWQDYQQAAAQRAEGLFQSSRAYATSGAVAQVPRILLNRGSRIVIRLGARQLQLYRGDALIATYPVAVGQDTWETPVGRFAVQDMRRDPHWQHPITRESYGPGPANPLGSRWIGFSQMGRYHIGLHGTNQEELVGQAVSHGCVRMREADIQALFDLVSLGTPIVVEP